jgi:hypothetical protein
MADREVRTLYQLAHVAVSPATWAARKGRDPRILTGGDVDAYLQDPAECNDATDKSLLPPNDTTGTPKENQPLRAGVCYTSTTLIHLRSVDASDAPPNGWSGPIAPVRLGNGVTYVTYWLLTPR